MVTINWDDFKPADVPAGGVDQLVAAITHVESGGNSDATSPQGARGSMQIMPATFKQYARDGEDYNDDGNRRSAAIRKIESDFNYYGGDLAKTAAAYIGGRGAVLADGTIREDVADKLGTTPAKYARMVVGRINGGKGDKPAVNWDDFKPVAEAAGGDVNWDDFKPVTEQPAKPADSKPGFIASAIDSIGSGMNAVKDELGNLRDSFFTGIDQSRAGLKTVNTAAQANALLQAQDKLKALEAGGQGATPAADGLRQTIAHYAQRLPSMMTDTAEAQADAKRGADMTTREVVKKMGAAKTFGEAWEAFKEAPYDAIAGITATSLPTTIPALLTAAVMGPVAGAAVMGMSSGVTEAGSSLADFAQDAGIDTTNPKALEAFFMNRDNLAQAMSYAGKRAGIIGSLDAASGGIAGKTLAPAMKSMIARQAVNLPAQMGVQAGLGAAGEAGGQLATKGKIDQPGQVVMEAVGELGGAPMEVYGFSKEAREALHVAKAVPKPDPIAAIGQATSVDEAIAAATAAVQSAPGESVAAVDNIEALLKSATPVPAESLPAAVTNPDIQQLHQRIAELENANARQTPVEPAPDAIPAPAPASAELSGADGTQSGTPVAAQPTEAALNEAAPPQAATQATPAQAPATGRVEATGPAAARAEAGTGGLETAGLTPPQRPTASWVIREKATGAVIMETFDPKKVQALNTQKYEAIPITEHLASLSNRDGEPAAPFQPAATLNSNGTLNIKGDPAAITAQLKDAGLTGIRTKDGVQVGKSQAVKAQSIFQQEAPTAQATPKQSAIENVAPAAPQQLGRNNTPLTEGGKPFKTRLAAADAKKLQPMMRVVAVKGGFALADKTPKQLAAEAKAARRLSNPQTSARGEPIPAHAFIASEGGLHADTRPDMNVGGNPRIGNRTLFAGTGKGLTMERATARLIEEGYLGEGAGHSEAMALIKRSLTQPQYNADGYERIAEADAQARFDDYLAAEHEEPSPELQDEDAAFLALRGYTEPTAQELEEINTLMQIAEAEGIDTEIALLHAEQVEEQVNTQDYAHDHAEIEASEHQPTGSSSRAETEGRRAEPGRPAAEPASNRNGQPADRQEGAGKGAPAEVAASPAARMAVRRFEETLAAVERSKSNGGIDPVTGSTTDRLESQAVEQQGIAEISSATTPEQKAEAVKAADARKSEFRTKKADRIEAAGGSKEIVNSLRETVTQATAILDAARVTGKDRLDILRDIKKGDITPDEVEAAYPAKEALTSVPAESANTNEPEQISVPETLGKIGPSTFPEPPVFESLGEVADWAEQRAKDLDMAKRQFTATHEYFHAYSQIEALAKKSKDEQAKELQAQGLELQAKMAAAGVKVGNKVKSTFAGPFLSSYAVTGTVYLNNNGVPTVRLDAAVPVTRAGGRPGMMTKTSWNSGFKPISDQPDRNLNRSWFDGVSERKVLGKLDDGRYVVSGRRIAADDAADGQYTHTANTVHTGAELEQLIAREQGSSQAGFSLETPTKEAILERDKRMAQANKADAKAATDAENKAKADASRNEFTLTGSDRAADVGAAGGQEVMFSRGKNKDVDDPTKGWNTSPDALRKMLGTPGYSQRPLAAIMRDVDAAQGVRNDLDRLVAGFPGTSASVNNQGLLNFHMPEGRQYDHRPYVDALKDFAAKRGLIVVVRKKAAGTQDALWRSLGFTPYTTPTENTVGFFGNTVSPNPVAWFWTGPGSSVTDATPMFSRGAPDQTDTPAFKAWFGDSKVVDAEGKPLVVYHGTGREFSEFDTRAASVKQANGNKTGTWGTYFTPSPGEASIYAEMSGGDQAVMPALLAIQNPYVMNRAEWRRETMAANKDGREVADATRSRLEAAGHDGMVIRDRGFNDEWVAFHPAQIKSATGNRGTFDAGNPDIRYSRTSDRQGGRSADDTAPGVLKDDNGKPLTLYHGGLVWDKFDSKQSGREALWLTPDVNVASGYGDQYSSKDGREIKAFNVRMDKPLDLTKPEVVDRVFGKDDAPAQHEIARDRSVIEQALRYAKENGYDGMIHPDSDNFNRYTNGQISYAVFSPDQLQLAPLTGYEEDRNTYGIPLRGKQNESAAPDSDGAFSRTPDRPDRQAFEPLANQSTARTLNDTLVNYGLGQDWSHAYEAVKLPDALSGVRKALQTTFGRDVRAVAPTADKFNIFNGVYIPSQPHAVYVNVAADVGFVNIAGHELWHTIKRQRPDLIDWYREHSRQFYKDLPAYRDRLNNLLQEGERKYSTTKAEEELEADFMGDSLADPQFLQQLADASPSKFKALLAHVRLWLSGVANKLKGLGSTQEVNDVKALQGYLKEVLVAFAEGRELPIPPQNIAPRFPHGTNQDRDQRNELAREYMEYRKTDPARAKAAFQAMSAIDAEARRAADAQEALTPKVQDTYKGEHEAPMHDSGKPLHDLTDAYPADFYGPKGPEWYGVGDGSDARAMATVRALKGRPGAPVAVYRAIPKDVTAKIGKGDWVTIDRQYAKDHGDGALNGNYKIIRKTVRADELFTNGDSIQEWGYDPKKLRDESAPDSDAVFSRSPADNSQRKADLSAQIYRLKERYSSLAFNDPQKAGMKLDLERLRDEFSTLGNNKQPRPSDQALQARYDSPDQVPADVRDWVRANTSLLTSDATDAVRWNRIADTLGDDRYHAGKMTIYRAVAGSDEIRPGDWVTTEKEYADDHLSRYLNGKGQVIEDTVDGRDVLISPTGNNEEAIYAPRSLSGDVANESTAPDSDGAPMFSRGPAAGPGLFQSTIWNTPDPTRTDRIIHKLQDGRVDLKRVQEAIKESGQDIEEKFDARLAETLYPGRVAYRSQQFLAGEVHPLLQAMALNKVAINELADYLHARHAPEANKVIAARNPAMPDGGAGTNTQGTLLTTQAARDYLANIPANKLAALTAIARKIDAITAGTRQLWVNEGLAKQEEVDAMQAAYKHYVPLFRDDAENGMPTHPIGAGFTVKGKETKQRTGSTKEVTNILAHVLMQREAAITRAEKNRVALSLYGLALSSPNPEFWTTIKPGMSNAQIGAELVAMGIDPMTASIGMEGGPTIRTVDPVTNKVIDRANPMYKSLPGAITLKVAGEDRVLMINAKTERGLRMAENLKNLDGLTNLDLAGSIIGKATRWIASVNTQYNPAFGVVNVVRDTLGGAVHLSNTALRGKSMEVLGHVPAAMTGIARELANPGQTGQWQKLYREFQADGGQTGFKENFRDPNERAKAVEKELAKLQHSGMLTPGKAAHAVLGLLDGFNTSMENAVRLSAYKTALDQGISRAESARLARELTVDFNRKGVAGRELGPLYAFFNASVQGNARTWQAIKGPAGTKIIAGGLALGMVQALMLAAAGYDDDELKEFEKTRSLVIPTNWSGQGKKTHIMIPYPLGLHVLPNTGRVIAELTLNGGKDIGKRTFNAVGEIASAMNPLGGGNVFTMHGALTTALPTVLDPAADVASNKNFSENDIERKPFNEEGDNRPGWARAREATQRSATGQVYIGISKAINAMTGGNAYEAGLASPTPEMVRYLGQVVGGGVLRELEKAVDGSVKTANGEKVKPSAVPLFSRFYGEVDGDSVETSRYYEAKHKLDKAQSSLKAAEKAGDMKAYTKLLRENPGVAAYGDLQKVQKSISELNKLAVETVNNPAQMKKIDALRTEQMSVVNKLLKKMEKGEPTLADRLRPGEAATP